MKTSLKKWGNSVGVRIPNEVLKQNGLSINDTLEITFFPGGITMKKDEKKSFRDIAEPIISTKNFKFDREEANSR